VTATTLEGRVALVSGATAGIGLAIAESLAAAGAVVALGGRRAGVAEQEAHRLGGIGIGMDLTDEDSLARAVERTRQELGEIDILVLNGGGPPASTAAGLEVAEARRAAELVLYGHLHLVNHCLAGMRERRWGRILAVGSGSVRQPIPGLATSGMFRAALANYLKLLATEVASDQVTVNMILPGRIDTARVAETDARNAAASGTSLEAVRAASQATIPAGRYGTPEEVAAAAAFLCSEAARYITGEQLRVDGGLIRAL
jgi:3-oxoacyl-[acyl-carrier protein] reductase